MYIFIINYNNNNNNKNSKNIIKETWNLSFIHCFVRIKKIN